ncbi:MAG: pantetheine-phosphate adenylyltransferase [Victivallaceae bacterium]
MKENLIKTVLYPGSFDPVTNGHLDLIERACRLFDRVIVGVAVNVSKSPLFTTEERIALLEKCCESLPNAGVVSFNGLLVDAVAKFQANAVLRGLRAFSDFEYELQMALMNRSLNEDCETIFMMPTPQNSFVSSRMVKEVAHLNGNFSQYVPPPVVAAIKAKIEAGCL